MPATSLSHLSAQDFDSLRNDWQRDTRYLVRKLGPKWDVSDRISKTVPLFDTQRDACLFVSNLIRAENEHRATMIAA